MFFFPDSSHRCLVCASCLVHSKPRLSILAFGYEGMRLSDVKSMLLLWEAQWNSHQAECHRAERVDRKQEKTFKNVTTVCHDLSWFVIMSHRVIILFSVEWLNDYDAEIWPQDEVWAPEGRGHAAAAARRLSSLPRVDGAGSGGRCRRPRRRCRRWRRLALGFGAARCANPSDSAETLAATPRGLLLLFETRHFSKGNANTSEEVLSLCSGAPKRFQAEHFEMHCHQKFWHSDQCYLNRPEETLHHVTFGYKIHVHNESFDPNPSPLFRFMFQSSIPTHTSEIPPPYLPSSVQIPLSSFVLVI